MRWNRDGLTQHSRASGIPAARVASAAARHQLTCASKVDLIEPIDQPTQGDIVNVHHAGQLGLHHPAAIVPRTLFNEEHEMFRDSVRRFIEVEITPFHEQWEKEGVVPRELWNKAGAAGLLCCNVPEEYGGPGADFLYNVVLHEELARAVATGPGFAVHSDMVANYIYKFGSEQQKQHWLPRMVSGESIGALGLTEPNAGSDLKAIKTRAVRDGDNYVISGQKVYISNG